MDQIEKSNVFLLKGSAVALLNIHPSRSLNLSLFLSPTHAHTHTRTDMCTRAHTLTQPSHRSSLKLWCMCLLGFEDMAPSVEKISGLVRPKNIFGSMQQPFRGLGPGLGLSFSRHRKLARDWLRPVTWPPTSALIGQSNHTRLSSTNVAIRALEANFLRL